LTTAVDASAIFPAVVVVKIPVGMIVIRPPLVDIGAGAVIVAIAVVPDTKLTIVVGAIVAAEAIVGAAPLPAIIPVRIVLLFSRVVPVAPATALPILMLVILVDTPAVPISIVLVVAAVVAPPPTLIVVAPVLEPKFWVPPLSVVVALEIVVVVPLSVAAPEIAVVPLNVLAPEIVCVDAASTINPALRV
jgi:hypothetical protein